MVDIKRLLMYNVGTWNLLSMCHFLFRGDLSDTFRS